MRMSKRVTDNEILAAVHSLTRIGVPLGPTVQDLASRLGVGEVTVVRRLGPLLEAGRVDSTPRQGILLNQQEQLVESLKERIKAGP
jgi:DNA-binding transcriptional regulator YhcF (GntR family)